MKKPEGERLELTHAPVPGYRLALYAMVAVSVIYLIIVFGRSLL